MYVFVEESLWGLHRFTRSSVLESPSRNSGVTCACVSPKQSMEIPQTPLHTSRVLKEEKDTWEEVKASGGLIFSAGSRHVT